MRVVIGVVVFCLSFMTIAVRGGENAGSLEFNGCGVEWDGQSLTLSNAMFRREYRAVGGTLRTVSFVAHGAELLGSTNRSQLADGTRFSASVGRAQYDPAGTEGIKATVAVGAFTNVYWVFPSVPGVLWSTTEVRNSPPDFDLARNYGERRNMEEDYYCAGADRLVLSANHVRVTAFDFMDQTDYSEELFQKREWMPTVREHPLAISCNVLSAENAATRRGFVFMRLAPMPMTRPVKAPDFIVVGRDTAKDRALNSVTPVANGYALAELAYEGGEFGRIRALQRLQRALREYRPGRDGIFISNTWGGGNGDSRISEAFLLKEVEAGAGLGVDAIQIDDGWQKGRSANSSDAKRRNGKAWGNFRSIDPEFWLPCPDRLPHGLEGIVGAAKKHGMRFGLWYGPDSTDDAARWKEDADFLLSLYHDYGIQYFKIDSLTTKSSASFLNQRKFFDRMLELSNGEMTFDLDVTCHDRPGYFGIPYIGPTYVENRYTQHAGWWPHHTLRNFWSLSQAIDPVRMRIEVADHMKHRELYRRLYGDDPLLPEKWRGDAIFAVAMMASPLGWFEVSELEAKTVSEMKPIVARWKLERRRMHGGTIYPVGERPDGFAWSGFASVSDDGGGYVLLFRELNASDAFSLATGELFPAAASAEVIGGRGKAAFSGRRLEVSVPEPLGFIWLKVNRKQHENQET